MSIHFDAEGEVLAFQRRLGSFEDYQARCDAKVTHLLAENGSTRELILKTLNPIAKDVAAIREEAEAIVQHTKSMQKQINKLFAELGKLKRRGSNGHG